MGTVAAVGARGGLLAAAVRHLLRAPDPLVDLRTLRIGTFRVAVASGSLSYMAIGAVPFLLPLLFENVFGWSAIKSGAVVLFVFVGNIGIKPATTFLLNRFGFRTVLIAACAALAASMAAAGFVTRRTPVVVIIVIAAISGVARSVGVTSYNTLGFCDVPEAQMPHANALAATVQQLSFGLGVAAATVALRLGDPLSRLLPGRDTSSPYTVAFVLVALLPLTAILASPACTATPAAPHEPQRCRRPVRSRPPVRGRPAPDWRRSRKCRHLAASELASGGVTYADDRLSRRPHRFSGNTAKTRRPSPDPGRSASSHTA